MAHFDYIVVGAGSAGCVLANRLSEDPSVSVLLLEAGRPDRHPFIPIPLAMRFVSRNPSVTWGYQTEPEPYCNDRVMEPPRGKVLGGTSSINAMIYARGHPLDYQQWRQLGLSGWSYEEVLPYFKRAENNWRGATDFHGGDGPLKVTLSAVQNPLHERLTAACRTAAVPVTEDFNGANPEGFAKPDMTIGDGRRSSTAYTFLRPAMKRPNLTVETGAQAHRVIIENGTATGVVYGQNGRTLEAMASREVILSGGSYNSPQLLLLSGIGPAEELRELGIEPILDRPAVGNNLQEHVNAFAIFELSTDESMSTLLRADRVAVSGIRWELFKTGPMTDFPTSAVGFVRVNPESERPDIEIIAIPVWQEEKAWFPGIRRPTPHRYTMRCAVLHPRSQGWVKLRSANPTDKPRIQWNLFEDPADLATLREGIKLIRRLFAQPSLAQMTSRETAPGPEVDSDDAIEAWLRDNCSTAQHPAGTCRMGSDDQAVVDETLKVRGIDGLRVADCSIMPNVVGSNTNAPTIMIAEKAADMILGRAPLPAFVGETTA